MFRFIMTHAVRALTLAMVPAAFALAQTGRIVGRVADAQATPVVRIVRVRSID